MERLLAGSFQTLLHSLKSIQQILHFPALQKPNSRPTRWVELAALKRRGRNQEGSTGFVLLKTSLHEGVRVTGIHPSIHWEGGRNTPGTGRAPDTHPTQLLLNLASLLLDGKRQKHHLKKIK